MLRHLFFKMGFSGHSVVNIKSFFQITTFFFSRNHTIREKVTLKSDRQVLSSCFNEPFWKKIPSVLQTSLAKMISRIKSRLFISFSAPAMLSILPSPSLELCSNHVSQPTRVNRLSQK